MFTRFHNLLRGCLLCVGVSNRKATITIPPPIVPETPVATSNVEEAPDLDDQLTAWEQDRSNTLHDAEESEQQDSKIVAERLGHSTTRVTQDTYQHVLPGMQERAASKLEILRHRPAKATSLIGYI